MRSHAVLLRLDDGERSRAEKLARRRRIPTLQTYLRTLIEEDAQAAGIKTDDRGPERRTRANGDEG